MAVERVPESLAEMLKARERRARARRVFAEMAVLLAFVITFLVVSIAINRTDMAYPSSSAVQQLLLNRPPDEEEDDDRRRLQQEGRDDGGSGMGRGARRRLRAEERFWTFGCS